MKKVLSFVLAAAMMLSLLTGLVLFESSAAGMYEYHFKLDKYTDKELRKFWSSPDVEKEWNCVQSLKNQMFSDRNHGIPETPALLIQPSEAATEAPMLMGFSPYENVLGSDDYLYAGNTLSAGGSIFEGIDVTNKKNIKMLFYGINTQSMGISIYLLSTTEKVAFKIDQDGPAEVTGRLKEPGNDLELYEGVYTFNLEGATATEGSAVPRAPLTDYYGKIDNMAILFRSGWYIEWLGISWPAQRPFILDLYTQAYTDTTELLTVIQKADKLGMNTELVKEAKELYKNVNNVSQEKVDTIVSKLKADISYYEFNDGKYVVPGFSRYTVQDLAAIDISGLTAEPALNAVSLTVKDGGSLTIKSGKEDNGMLTSVNDIGVFAGHDLSNKTALGFKVSGFNGSIKLTLRSSTSTAKAEYTASPDANGVYEFVLDENKGGHNVMDGVELTFTGLLSPNKSFVISDWYIKAPVNTARLLNVLNDAEKFGPENMGMSKEEYDAAWAIYDNLASTQEQVDEAADNVAKYVNSFDYDTFVARKTLNELLETADFLGMFDDDEDPVYLLVCEADEVYNNPESKLEDYLKQSDIVRGEIARVTMEEDLYEVFRKCKNAWEFNYTEESYKELQKVVLFVFENKDEYEDDELIAMLEEAYGKLELLDIYRHTITGVTDWIDTDIEDLMLGNADKIGENVDGDHDFSNDTFYMSVGDDGIKYFNMYCEEDKINMGYKTMDRSGETLFNGYKGDAYPHNNFFGDMKGYLGIRFKLLCDGHFDSFVFKISNCSTRYSLYMESAVHDITMDSVDCNGYINLPFTEFKSDSWVDDTKASLLENLDKGIVMVVEAKGATEGTTVSVGDFNIYTEYAEDYPEIGGTIKNGGKYDVATAGDLYTTFDDGFAKLDGEDYTSGTVIDLVEGRHRIHHKYGSLEKTIDFEIFDGTPTPIITGVEEGGVYDLYVQDAPIVSWDIGTATLNDQPIEKGSAINEVGKYKLVVTNGTKSAEVNFEVADSATVPKVEGVEDGKVYDLYKEAAPAITWDVGTATLNDQPFEKGSTVSALGDYTLTVVNGSKSTTIKFSVVDTATVPKVTGVEEGMEYDLYKVPAPAATWDVGTATLNDEPYTAGTPIEAVGSYVLKVVNGSKDITINFNVVDTATVPMVLGVGDGAEYDLYTESAPAAIWDVGTATLNDEPYTPGTRIEAVGSYVLKVVNGSKSITINFTVVDTATVPEITGIENGQEFDLHDVDAPSATWDVGTATLDGEPYTAGTPIEAVGAHTLTVVNGSKTTTVEFTVKNTSTVPEVEGVEEGAEFDLAAGKAVLTWNVGTATLNGNPIESGYEITEPGEYKLVIKDGTETKEINFTVVDTTPPYMKGDFDDDKEITVADALAALRIAAKLVPEDDTSILIGDVDNDQHVTVADALAILRVAAKLTNTL